MSDFSFLFICSMKFLLENRIAPDGTPRLAASHLGLTICSHCILSICNIYLFPILVLRAGFAF